jgi:putative hemolysin
MLILLKAAGIIGLVGLNGFFVAAEYSLLSVRRTRLEQLAREGRPHALLTLRLLSDVGLLFSGIQLGVTIASLLMGWLGEQVMSAAVEQLIGGRVAHFAALAVAHTVAAVVAFLFITVVLMVLGELVPKAIAYERAEATALLVAPLMDLFLRLGRYPIRLLNALSDLVLRLIGRIPAGGHGRFHTLDEVKLIVATLRKRGLLGAEQEEMIHSVFDLHRIRVREIMVPRPQIACLPLTENLGVLLEQMVQKQHSRIPVYEGSVDHIVGVLHAKDLLRVAWDRLRGGIPLTAPFDLRTFLREPMIVPETMPLITMLDHARRRRVQMAFVVDEFGTLVGLVTIQDVLEEIVGEIQDEYDRVETPSSKTGDQPLVVEGGLKLRELTDDYHIALPRSAGYETLAGFLLYRLGALPKGGESLLHEGRRYTVLEMKGRRITRVKIEKLVPRNPQTQRPSPPLQAKG